MVISRHLGVEIHVTEDGRFSAAVDGKTVNKRTLRELQKLIEAHQSGTACFVDSGLNSKVSRREIVGVERGEFRFRDGTRHKSWSGTIYLMNIEIADALDALAKEYSSESERLDRERGKLLRKCRPLDPDTFKGGAH
jgi:hypothetical protein